jgi:hypothetical protein
MVLIKKIDVDKYFAERRAIRMGRIGPASPPDAARTEPAGKSTNAPSLISNRTPRNSSPNIPPTVIPRVAGSGARENRTLPGSGQK